MRSAKNNWDFWTSLPEALHQITIVMSDRGLPATYRHMHGFGSHTFSFVTHPSAQRGEGGEQRPIVLSSSLSRLRERAA